MYKFVHFLTVFFVIEIVLFVHSYINIYKLHWLFERIIRTLQVIYDSKKIELGLTSHSNLFKTDSNYKKHIIPGIYDKLYVDTYAYESNLKNLLDVLND